MPILHANILLAHHGRGVWPLAARSAHQGQIPARGAAVAAGQVLLGDSDAAVEGGGQHGRGARRCEMV